MVLVLLIKSPGQLVSLCLHYFTEYSPPYLTGEYEAEAKMGTPGQKVFLVLDTANKVRTRNNVYAVHMGFSRYMSFLQNPEIRY